MTPDRWRRLNAIYDAALAHEAGAREAFVRRECGSDEALQREVISLLASPDSAAAFLSTPAYRPDTGGETTPAAEALAPGDLIGQYRIESLVGRGGMGEVYRARDLRLGRDVAIKVLPPAFTADANRLSRFESEARVLASLNHPHIAAIYGVEEHGGLRALVLELVEGRTLDEIVPLPIEAVLNIARQIVDALDAAHERGIVHRDLKPPNIKVTGDGVVKLLDFGLAKVHGAAINQTASDQLTTPKTEEGLILGTIAYMSPEQARGLPVDKRTDIWAFGCVLFELLTGSRPFEGETTSDVLAAILQAEPDWSGLPADTPQSVRRLLARCLEKNAKLRLRDIGDARVELGDGEPHTLPIAAPTRRTLRRRDWIAIASLPLVGALAGRYWRPGLLPPASYQRITYRRGVLLSAHFSRDAQEVFYSAIWTGGKSQLYSTRPGDPESRPVGVTDADIFSVSQTTGELAIALRATHTGGFTKGTLARLGSSAVAPRPVRDNVVAADWSPDGQSLAIAFVDNKNTYRLEFPPDNLLYESQHRIVDIRVAPDGQSVVIASQFAILVVDLQRRVREISKDWAITMSALWQPDTDEIWFTASRLASGGNAAEVLAVSQSGRQRRVLSLPGGVVMHDRARDGRLLISTKVSTKGIRFRARRSGEERDLSWLDWSLAHDISADGSMLLFSEGGQGDSPGRGVYVRRLMVVQPIASAPARP